MPFFTIITSTCNVASTLPRLAKSLAIQTCRDFEWVVQDGASKDNTASVVEQWRAQIPSVSFESVPDNGIYDAWNRAIVRVGSNIGQWVLFLGGDDLLYSPTCLAEVKLYLNKLDRSKKYCATGMQYICKNGSYKLFPVDNVESLNLFSASMSFRHPALFHHASLFESERFDTSFKIAGDYDFLRKTLRADNTAGLSIYVTIMHDGGCSSNSESFPLLMRENARILLKYFDIFNVKLVTNLLFCYRMVFICSLKSILEKTIWGNNMLLLYRKIKKNL